MKKLCAILLALLLAVPALAAGEKAVASVYPVYVFALNLLEGIEGAEIRLLAGTAAGCLHDYQLQTADMRALADADIFLVNGAGMEVFLPMVENALPQLPVADASAGVELLYGEGHTHSHDHADDHDHTGEVPNAHIWLDVANAKQMVRNLCDGLVAVWPQHQAALEENRDAYLSRLDALEAEVQRRLQPLAGQSVVTFHEAFPYFAKAYGLHVAAVVTTEADESLSPAALGRLVRTVKELGNPPLFVEPQYSDLSVRTVAAETGAPVYVLDPAVTGPEGAADYYETVMLQNVDVLQQAFAPQQ